MAEQKTLQQLAQDALAVQDACNLSGVAQGFARAMLSLRGLGLDTEQCNNNVITIVWLDKLTQLANIKHDSHWRLHVAYDSVHRLAETGHV